MKRPALLLFALAALAAPSAGMAATDPPGPVAHFAQATALGFYRGKVVEYLDFGPVRLAGKNKLAPLWAFTNGADGQRNIIDTVPGRSDYSPLWAVRMVTWKAGVTPRVLTSAATVRRAVAAGEATVRATSTVVNCPVV
jgi:hypothetical protein